ncbi:hypothetical protein CYMTET_4338, partial [Cymbomonas tetramitiformis]
EDPPNDYDASPSSGGASNGYISVVMNRMARLVQQNRHIIAQAILQHNADGDGRVTQEDLRMALGTLPEDSLSHLDLRCCLAHLDAAITGDGRISEEELASALSWWTEMETAVAALQQQASSKGTAGSQAQYEKGDEVWYMDKAAGKEIRGLVVAVTPGVGTPGGADEEATYMVRIDGHGERETVAARLRPMRTFDEAASPAACLPERSPYPDTSIIAQLISRLGEPSGVEIFHKAAVGEEGKVDAMEEMGNMMDMMKLEMISRDIFFIAAMVDINGDSKFTLPELQRELRLCQAVRYAYWHTRCAMTGEPPQPVRKCFTKQEEAKVAQAGQIGRVLLNICKLWNHAMKNIEADGELFDQASHLCCLLPTPEGAPAATALAGLWWVVPQHGGARTRCGEIAPVLERRTVMGLAMWRTVMGLTMWRAVMGLAMWRAVMGLAMWRAVMGLAMWRAVMGLAMCVKGERAYRSYAVRKRAGDMALAWLWLMLATKRGGCEEHDHGLEAWHCCIRSADDFGSPRRGAAGEGNLSMKDICAALQWWSAVESAYARNQRR